MKRKRGKKKGKKKGGPAATVAAANETAVELVNLDGEDNSGADEYDDGDDNNNNDDDIYKNEEQEEEEEEDKNEEQEEEEEEEEEEEHDSVMQVDTPSSTGTDQPVNLASIKPDGSIDKTIGKSVGCVKVKLKTSKALESQSDTDKSSLQMGLEKQGVASDKMEDTGNSVPEAKTGGSKTVSKKPGSIKIKSSKIPGTSSVVQQDETLKRKEPRTPVQESQFNKQELDSALSVIKKVMKMDAAEPFNVPVNPEALGIPDYFDVIDTPMDFGTICSNLEKGDKYMNSEDVYKDVQYIWKNCFKYNNKGDYILDLMRRVKKNFMKYWTAAGLFTEQSRGSSGEGAQGEDGGASSQGHGKSGHSKQKKNKGHGRRHKSDCLCAICVLKRRRREREENARLAKGQIGTTDSKVAQDLKQEGSSLIESPGGEDSSSNMDESLDPDADVDVEGEGPDVKMEDNEQQYSSGKEKHEQADEEEDDEEEEDEENETDMENQKKGKVETSENLEYASRSGEENIQQSPPGLTENAGAVTHTLKAHGEESAEIEQNMRKESQERQQKAKMLDKFRSENPLLLSLCQTLFPNNRRSIWNGPYSLFQHQGSTRTSSIHASIKNMMK